MGAILSTLIGIVFVILLFSILTSALRELIAGYLSLRGKQLLFAIYNMVGKDTGDEFVQHPFFRQLTIGSRERSGTGDKRSAVPAYINSGTFSAILLDVLAVDSPDMLETRLHSIPESPLKKVLLFLNRQANGDVLQFRLKVEEWFNEVMDRASGAFKRNTQRWLFFIGLIVAIVFNADVIQIYHSLSINATLSNTLADEATAFVQNQPAPLPDEVRVENPSVEYAQQEITQLLQNNISVLESPLGLGWSTVNWQVTNDPIWWLYKVMGWLTMAMGISLGATFWFDMLKKMVSLRSSGPASVSPTASGISTTPMVPVGSTLTRKEPDTVLESFSRTAPAPKPKPKDDDDKTAPGTRIQENPDTGRSKNDDVEASG